MFTNVTATAGLNYQGRTWAASWGDVNGDGFPDLLVSKHNSHATVANAEDITLHLNQRDGTFTNATADLVQYVQKDFHGAVWGDYDNDGDLDFVVTSGSTSKGGLTLIRNEDGEMVNRTTEVGLAGTNKLIGRGVHWLDFNNDGRLDIYIGADSRPDGAFPASIFQQTELGTFVDARAETGLNVTSAVAPLLSDLNGDGRQELILTHYGAISRIYDTTTLPFTDIKAGMIGSLNIPQFNDMAIADFNNDGRPDIYLTRNGFRDEVVVDGQELKAYVLGGGPKSFSFETWDDPTFTFSKQDGTIKYEQIFVGENGLNLITNQNRPFFTLAADNPNHVGIKPHTNQEVGVYIGYDAAAGHWQVQVALGAKPARGFLVESTTDIGNLQTQGFAAQTAPAPDQILINTVTSTGATRFADRSASLGIASMSIAGNHLGTGDFDNDGDVDIYIDQAGPAANRPNVLLQNQGFGKFVLVPAGDEGAAGSLDGTGGSVAVADFNRDGFLDIALNNGGGEPPFIPLNNDGPLQLYRNVPNNNNWIEVRLHGIQSNVDGLGAKVLVTTGSKTQMREATNGQSIDGQDFLGLHFGVGGRTVIDRLEVRWPNGGQTVLTNVPVDQFLDVFENQGAAGTIGQVGSLDDPTGWTQADASFSLFSTEQRIGDAWGTADGDLGTELSLFLDGSGDLPGTGYAGEATDAVVGGEGESVAADAGVAGGDWLIG